MDNAIRTLYLRPFNFIDLAKIFCIEEFDIEFLLCPKPNRKKIWEHEFIDQHGRETKPLKCLHRKGSINRILEVLQQNKLYPQEYTLQLKGKLKVRSCMYSGDAIFTFENGIENQYLSKIMDQWHLTGDYNYTSLAKFKQHILYDVTSGRAKALYKPKRPTQLHDYLYADICQDGDNYIQHNMPLPIRERIYYSCISELP